MSEFVGRNVNPAPKGAGFKRCLYSLLLLELFLVRILFSPRALIA